MTEDFVKETVEILTNFAFLDKNCSWFTADIYI